MKKINFITTRSPSEQYTNTLWQLMTILLTSITIITISIMQIRQLICLRKAQASYHALQREKINLDNICTTKEKLKKEIVLLRKKINQVKQITTSNERLLQLLSWIDNNLTEQLEQFTINSDEWNFTLNDLNITFLEQIIRKLKEDLHIKLPNIEALEQNSQNVWLIVCSGKLD